MNAIGYSKRGREIHRHCEHPRNVLMNIFRIAGKCMITIVGNTAEGMRGDIYSDERNGDDDLLFRNYKIKLYTSRANNINNPLLLPLHDNADYTASFFVVEDDNFPGYVKLSLMEGNCTNMNDDKTVFKWHARNVYFDEQFYHKKLIHHPIKLCIPQHVYILLDQNRTTQTIR